MGPFCIQDALDVAQKEFPEFLKSIPRERIGFYMHADVGRQRHRVRISESAWASTIARMQRAEIVDVSTRPDGNSEKDAPPEYLSLPEEQPTSTLLLPAHSNPSSRAPSPTPSTGNKNPRSWFGTK